MTTPTHKDFQQAAACLDSWVNSEKAEGHPLCECEQIIRTALAAMADENWQLVPKEPTDQMLEIVLPLCSVDMKTGEPLYNNRHGRINYWRTSLSAAPKYEVTK